MGEMAEEARRGFGFCDIAGVDERDQVGARGGFDDYDEECAHDDRCPYCGCCACEEDVDCMCRHCHP